MITVPGDQSAEATSAAGAVVSYPDATAVDSSGNPLAVTCDPASGSTFAVGASTVTCTATDPGNGETASATFTVTVTDTTAPTLVLPGDLSAEATGPSGAQVSFSATATDIVDGTVAVSCSPGNGSTFPIAPTPVSCTAQDAHGNQSNGGFTVLVVDTTVPVVTFSAPASVEATGPSGAVVAYSVSATDTVDGAVAVSCSPDSGSTFALGTTPISCAAADSRGNQTLQGFSVTVADTTAPALTLPSPAPVEATGPAGASVAFSATASDIVSAAVTPTCVPASGSTFGLGTTNVTCTATDAQGNAASGSFGVVVQDTTAPVLTVPSTVEETTTVLGPVVVTYSASATDLVDGGVPVSCVPASGTLFPIGTTSVSCTATDARGRSATASFPVTVTLVDTTSPVVTVPPPMTVEAKTPLGTSVTFAASATDNIDGALTPTCKPASDSIFELGETEVVCTATDAHGNAGQGTFTIEVVDTTVPKLVMPAGVAVEANAAYGAVVQFTVVATDNIDGPLVPSLITCAPSSGSRFPLGTTDVRCEARDAHHNVGQGVMTVSVIDTTPPVLTVPAPIQLAASASGLPVSDPAIARFLAGARAEDMVDAQPSIKHDAPALLPLGTTTIKFVAADDAGNQATAKSTLTLATTPAPAAPTAVDRIPPDNVRGLRVESGNRTLRLRWRRPAAQDFDHVQITRSANQVGAPETPVFRGKATTFRDRRLTNGTSYRYVIVSYDRAGNRSAGVAVIASPKATLLLSPLDGARLSAPPTLKWATAAGASYYNLQVYRARRKVLTVWIRPRQYRLKRQWTSLGRRERLVPGFYTWFVFPGTGNPAVGNYGPLMGQSSFTIVR